jgi:hypothetical protein
LLRQLKVQDCKVSPAALLRMPQLQHFTLDDDPVADFHGIPAALQHLQQLQTVQLGWLDVEATECAGLTASSHLKSPELNACTIPASAGRHMFWQGQLMPQLQLLKTTGCETDWYDDTREALDDFSNWSVLLRNGDADRIVKSCPALQSLGTLAIAEGLPHDQVLPLLQLNALTQLSIGGYGCTDAVAEQLLAKMTGGRSSRSCTNIASWLAP